MKRSAASNGLRACGLACALACAPLAACGGSSSWGLSDFRWQTGPVRPVSGPAFSVRWIRDIGPSKGPYVPAELAAPVTAASIDRVYVGSTAGKLWALDDFGRPVFQHTAKAAIEAPPTLDALRNELYVASVDGSVSSLNAESGAERWQTSIDEAISQGGLLSADAVYLVSDLDTVVALSRADGSVLWRYRRSERPEGFAIVGHAGLAFADRRVLAAFSDGVVAALDSSDGRVLWELDTSLDVPELDATQRYLDVDTTPVVVDGVAYLASFTGGLYGVDVASGTVRQHESQLHGIAGLASDGHALIVASAEQGVLCLELPSLAPRWRFTFPKGAPGVPVIAGGQVFVPESQGGLIALSVADGHERGRLNTSNGVTTAPALAGGRGFVLSNAGRLFAFTYGG